MAIVVLRELTKAYAGATVLVGASLVVGRRERLGLVGRNGQGKTTLLRMIAGVEEPDGGSRECAGGARIGLLDQQRPLEFAGSLEAAMSAEFAELQELESQLRVLEECLADPSRPEARGRDPEGLARAYANLTERFEAAGGYGYRTQVAQALTGLGFRPADFGRCAGEFSGGEKVRAALARLLLSAPDLLLLDEPTNHLDLAATEWLEAYLAGYPGALVVVSHDRYFLDRLAGRVAELEGGRLRVYGGNYTDFVRQKEEELLRDAVQARELQGRIEQLRAFVAKFSAGTRASQAKSKAKMLARVEVQAQSLRRREVGGPAFRFEARQASGREVLSVQGLAVDAGPDGKRLFEGLSFRLGAGDRLALIGPNGCGKTTLMRTLLGQHPPREGAIGWGQGVITAYLSQDLSHLPDEETALEALVDAASMTPGEARSLLGSFGFGAAEAQRRVGDLSGGERCRLALAGLLVSGANLLMLDEPTNHLDLPARVALEEALTAFRGTVVLVSHDRYFVDRVATSVLVFEAGAGPVYHRGNFSSYRAWRQALAAPAAPLRRADDEMAALLAERAALETEMARDRASGRPRRARERLQRYREIEALIQRRQGGRGGRR